MAALKDVPAVSNPVATPNPKETMLRVRIDPGLMQSSDGRDFGTLYRNCPPTFIDRTKITRGYGDYILNDIQNGQDAIFWYFVKTRTDLERNTPYRDQTVNRKGVPWPNVLKWVEFGEDFGFPLSQETIDGAGNRALVISGRPVILYSWLPGMSLTTKVRVRKFLSEIPFPDHETVSNEPRPTEVSFDYIGKDGGFPNCLHPDITVPGHNRGYRVLGSAGKPESGNRTANNSQFFPETNHKDWQTYIVTTVDFENGLYMKTEETFYVPRRPKLSEKQT